MDPRAARSSWLATTLAMLAAVPMYAVVAWVLSSSEARPDGSLARRFQTLFQIAGPMVALAGAAWMRLRVLREPTPRFDALMPHDLLFTDVMTLARARTREDFARALRAKTRLGKYLSR